LYPPANHSTQLVTLPGQSEVAVLALHGVFVFAVLVGKKTHFKRQIDHHAQLLVPNIQSNKGCFFVVPFLRLYNQVVHIQKRLPN
jgi:hypothetical protein